VLIGYLLIEFPNIANLFSAFTSLIGPAMLHWSICEHHAKKEKQEEKKAHIFPGPSQILQDTTQESKGAQNIRPSYDC
jgi:hypothetical protein